MAAILSNQVAMSPISFHCFLIADFCYIVHNQDKQVPAFMTTVLVIKVSDLVLLIFTQQLLLLSISVFFTRFFQKILQISSILKSIHKSNAFFRYMKHMFCSSPAPIVLSTNCFVTHTASFCYSNNCPSVALFSQDISYVFSLCLVASYLRSSSQSLLFSQIFLNRSSSIHVLAFFKFFIFLITSVLTLYTFVGLSLFSLFLPTLFITSSSSACFLPTPILSSISATFSFVPLFRCFSPEPLLLSCSPFLSLSFILSCCSGQHFSF